MSGTAIAKLDLQESAIATADEFFYAVRAELRRPLHFEEWESLGGVLAMAHKQLERQRTTALLAIGDWLVYGRKAMGDHRLSAEDRAKYHERYSQAASLTGYDPGYLYNIAGVCFRWPPDRRLRGDIERWPDLSIGHMMTVSSIDRRDPQQAEMLLDSAQEAGWTRSQLRLATGYIRQIATEQGEDKTALPVGNGPEPMQVSELAYYSDLLRDLLLMHAPDKYSRAMHDMPTWVWRMVTELLLAEFTNRSRDERRKDAVEMGPGPTG